MRWRLLWPVVTFMGLLTVEASSQQPQVPVVFAGELRSVTLIRPDFQRMYAPHADGSMRLSNRCGEETAVLRVIRSNARLHSPQTLHFTLGEWCRQPIEFPHDHWLIVARLGLEEAAAFPIFVSDDGIVFALVSDEGAYRRQLPEELQHRLSLQVLPSPVEYPLPVDLSDVHSREFISRQSSLEIRDDKVWVVRAILLANLFPGFSQDDLRHSRAIAN